MMEEMKNQSGIPSIIEVRATSSFLLTFVLSWLIWIPLDLSHIGIAFNVPESISNIVRLLGVLMPAASALILTKLTGGRDAMRNLKARLFLKNTFRVIFLGIFAILSLIGWMRSEARYRKLITREEITYGSN